jgi:transcriptional regulator with XRE-family HTH domain
MRIGERIAARRAELGLSQTQLAKAVGLSQATIGKLESGISSGHLTFIGLPAFCTPRRNISLVRLMTHPPGRCLLPHLSKSPNI